MDSFIVIGGGAAGFFAAIEYARRRPDDKVVLLERNPRVLAKVLISGGGRCNLTNATFDPRELVKNYPRGHKELLGPFHSFQPKDTLRWFEAEGVACKTEADGRVFPTTDQSATVADALVNAAKKAGVDVRSGVHVSDLKKNDDGSFTVDLKDAPSLSAGRLLLATGSAAQGWHWARQLGHKIILGVPSLFTFTIDDDRLKGLSGVSVKKAEVRLSGTKLSQTGPVLITHWGLSGPAILKLSAWAARELSDKQYRADIILNWVNRPFDPVMADFKRIKKARARQKISTEPLYALPKRLWERLHARASLPGRSNWADVSNKQITDLAAALTRSEFHVSGKSAFKDEFVTCGGVSLKEVDFRTMESRVCPGLYLAGEILDVDAVTGGFNFQNAWTTGWLAGQ